MIGVVKGEILVILTVHPHEWHLTTFISQAYLLQLVYFVKFIRKHTVFFIIKGP